MMMEIDTEHQSARKRSRCDDEEKEDKDTMMMVDGEYEYSESPRKRGRFPSNTNGLMGAEIVQDVDHRGSGAAGSKRCREEGTDSLIENFCRLKITDSAPRRRLRRVVRRMDTRSLC